MKQLGEVLDCPTMDKNKKPLTIGSLEAAINSRIAKIEKAQDEATASALLELIGFPEEAQEFEGVKNLRALYVGLCVQENAELLVGLSLALGLKDEPMETKALEEAISGRISEMEAGENEIWACDVWALMSTNFGLENLWAAVKQSEPRVYTLDMQQDSVGNSTETLEGGNSAPNQGEQLKAEEEEATMARSKKLVPSAVITETTMTIPDITGETTVKEVEALRTDPTITVAPPETMAEESVETELDRLDREEKGADHPDTKAAQDAIALKAALAETEANLAGEAAPEAGHVLTAKELDRMGQEAHETVAAPVIKALPKPRVENRDGKWHFTPEGTQDTISVAWSALEKAGKALEVPNPDVSKRMQKPMVPLLGGEALKLIDKAPSAEKKVQLKVAKYSSFDDKVLGELFLKAAIIMEEEAKEKAAKPAAPAPAAPAAAPAKPTSAPALVWSREWTSPRGNKLTVERGHMCIRVGGLAIGNALLSEKPSEGVNLMAGLHKMSDAQFDAVIGHAWKAEHDIQAAKRNKDEAMKIQAIGNAVVFVFKKAVKESKFKDADLRIKNIENSMKAVMACAEGKDPTGAHEAMKIVGAQVVAAHNYAVANGLEFKWENKVYSWKEYIVIPATAKPVDTKSVVPVAAEPAKNAGKLPSSNSATTEGVKAKPEQEDAVSITTETKPVIETTSKLDLGALRKGLLQSLDMAWEKAIKPTNFKEVTKTLGFDSEGAYTHDGAEKALQGMDEAALLGLNQAMNNIVKPTAPVSTEGASPGMAPSNPPVAKPIKLAPGILAADAKPARKEMVSDLMKIAGAINVLNEDGRPQMWANVRNQLGLSDLHFDADLTGMANSLVENAKDLDGLKDSVKAVAETAQLMPATVKAVMDAEVIAAAEKAALQAAEEEALKEAAKAALKASEDAAKVKRAAKTPPVAPVAPATNVIDPVVTPIIPPSGTEPTPDVIDVKGETVEPKVEPAKPTAVETKAEEKGFLTNMTDKVKGVWTAAGVKMNALDAAFKEWVGTPPSEEQLMAVGIAISAAKGGKFNGLFGTEVKKADVKEMFSLMSIAFAKANAAVVALKAKGKEPGQSDLDAINTRQTTIVAEVTNATQEWMKANPKERLALQLLMSAYLGRNFEDEILVPKAIQEKAKERIKAEGKGGTASMMSLEAAKALKSDKAYAKAINKKMTKEVKAEILAILPEPTISDKEGTVKPEAIKGWALSLEKGALGRNNAALVKALKESVAETFHFDGLANGQKDELGNLVASTVAYAMQTAPKDATEALLLEAFWDAKTVATGGKNVGSRGFVKGTAWVIYLGGAFIIGTLAGVVVWAVRPVMALWQFCHSLFEKDADKKKAKQAKAWETLSGLWTQPWNFAKEVWFFITGSSAQKKIKAEKGGKPAKKEVAVSNNQTWGQAWDTVTGITGNGLTREISTTTGKGDAKVTVKTVKNYEAQTKAEAVVSVLLYVPRVTWQIAKAKPVATTGAVVTAAVAGTVAAMTFGASALVVAGVAVAGAIVGAAVASYVVKAAKSAWSWIKGLFSKDEAAPVAAPASV